LYYLGSTRALPLGRDARLPPADWGSQRRPGAHPGRRGPGPGDAAAERVFL